MDHSSQYTYPNPEDEQQRVTNATAYQSGYTNIWQPDGFVAYHAAWNGAYYGAGGGNHYPGPAPEANDFGMALANAGMTQQLSSTNQFSIPQQVGTQQVAPQQVSHHQVNFHLPEANDFGMAPPNAGMTQQPNNTNQFSIPQQVGTQQVATLQAATQQAAFQQITPQQQRTPIVVEDKCQKCPALA